MRKQYGQQLASGYQLLGADLFLPRILARNGHVEFENLKQEDLLSVLGRDI